MVLFGEGLRGIPSPTPLAQGVRVPSVLRGRGMADETGTASMLELCPADFADGGDALRGHAQATAPVVPSDLVFHQPKARDQRPGFAAGSGAGKLPDGLGLAPEAPSGDGTTRSRSLERRSRGGRDLPWWARL